MSIVIDQAPKRSRSAVFVWFAVLLLVSIGSIIRQTCMLNGYAGFGVEFDFDDSREQAPTKIVSLTAETATVDVFAPVTVTGGNNTLDNNNNNNSNSNYESAATIRKPQLILHIGPSKTGTSTIQCGLHGIEKKLNEDNFYYIGSFIPHMGCGGNSNQLKSEGIVSFHYHDFSSCLKLGKACKDQNNGTRFQNFANVFEYHRSMGHTIIYSSEHLGKIPRKALAAGIPNEPFELMKELFLGFDVKVVYTYRHYFSWLLSVFNEGYKMGYINAASNTFRGNKWPGSEAKYTVGSIPPLSKTIDKLMRNTLEGDGRYGNDILYMFREESYHVVDKYKEFFEVDYFLMEPPTIDIDPHHVSNASQHKLQDSSSSSNSNSVLANFLCQMSPDARHACSYLKKIAKKEGDVVENSSVDLEADRLVTAVYEKQWYDENNTNTNIIVRNGPIRQAFDKYLKEKKAGGMAPYPWECPLEAKALLHRSIALMRTMMVQNPNDERETRQIEIVESQIRAKFSEYADKHKICNLDVDSFLEINESEIRALVAKVRTELELLEAEAKKEIVIR